MRRDLKRLIREFLAMGITVNAHIDAEENGDGTHWEESTQLDVMPDDGIRDAAGDDRKSKSDSP